jgi:hypothetical protein
MTQTQQEKIRAATIKFWTDGDYIYKSDIPFWDKRATKFFALLASMGVVVKAEDQAFPTVSNTACTTNGIGGLYKHAGFVRVLPLLEGEKR